MGSIWKRIKRWYRHRGIKVKILNIDEAVQLYSLLGKYSPDEKEAETAFDFISIIIDRASKDNVEIIGQVLDLVTENSLEEIEKKLESFELLDLLISGLIENRFLSMKYFFESF